MLENISEFWFTTHSFCEKYGYSYRGFELYGTVHMFWLLLCFSLCVFGGMLYRRSSEKTRRAVLCTISGVLLTLEMIKYASLILTGQWEWQFLPLHLCTINIYVIFLYALHPNDLIAELLYAVCMPGAAIALVSPSWTQVPINNFLHIDSSLTHVLLILFPVLLLWGGFTPSLKRLWKVVLILAALCVPIYIIDIILNEDFFFLNGDNTNPVLVFLGDIFPDYRMGMPVVAAIAWAVMYLPWTLKSWKKLNTECNN